MYGKSRFAYWKVHNITKYGSTLCIGKDEVLAHYAVHSKIPICTFTFTVSIACLKEFSSNIHSTNFFSRKAGSV